MTAEPAITRESLTERLLHFVNEVLPGLDRRGRTWLPLCGSDDPLFSGGRLDSLNILHLIAAIEEFTGEPVPDHMIVMKHFQTIEAIAAAFCRHES